VSAPLPWQQAPWRIVSAALQQARLPHALLLVGPGGVGKRRFAQSVAAAVLCEKPEATPCGECRSCRQCGVGVHPSLTVMQREADHRDISIDAVRELCATLNMTSHDGRAKVALIDPVDALNLNGVNALLKTLEEPPRGSLMVLLSERPLALPATLRSRCQQLRFGIPEASRALAWLAQNHPETAVAEREHALQVARGAPLLAVSLLTQDGALQRYHDWAALMTGLGQGDPLQAAAAIGREQAAAFFTWLPAWLLEQLQQLEDRASAQALTRLAGIAVEASRRLQGNANPQLLLESVLIDSRAILAGAATHR